MQCMHYSNVGQFARTYIDHKVFITESILLTIIIGTIEQLPINNMHLIVYSNGRGIFAVVLIGSLLPTPPPPPITTGESTLQGADPPHLF
jgi:hypothetical protein